MEETPSRTSEFPDPETGERVTFIEHGKPSIAFTQQRLGNTIVRSYCTIGRPLRSNVELPPELKTKLEEELARIRAWKQEMRERS